MLARLLRTVQDLSPALPTCRGYPSDGQIEPRDSAYVPVDIKVTDTVRPGKHLLIFQVPIEWGLNEHLRKANVIAQQQFEVGILGESDLLTALGLPSF